MPLDSDTRNAIVQRVTAYGKQLERVRRDPNLSDVGKQRAMAKLYVQTRDDVAMMREAADRAYRTRYSQLESVAFGIHAQSSDPSAAISLRDALDRAAQVANPDEARQLLNRAVVTGDETLARAIALTAYSNQGPQDLGDHWAAVYDHYRQAQPAQRQKVLDELDTLRQADSKQARFADALSTGVSRPTELANVGNVDHLAGEADAQDQGVA
jgi:hypothetical protein